MATSAMPRKLGRYGSSFDKLPIDARPKPRAMGTNGARQQVEARIGARPPTASAVELDLELEFSGDIRSFLLAITTVDSVHMYGVKHEIQTDYRKIGGSCRRRRRDRKVLSTLRVVNRAGKAC